MTSKTKITEEQNSENNLSSFLDDAEENEDEMDYEEHISDHTGITSDDSVSLYLNEMSRVPLLTRDEEITLAKKMVLGREARQTMIDSDGEIEDIEDGLGGRRLVPVHLGPEEYICLPRPQADKAQGTPFDGAPYRTGFKSRFGSGGIDQGLKVFVLDPPLFQGWLPIGVIGFV